MIVSRLICGGLEIVGKTRDLALADTYAQDRAWENGASDNRKCGAHIHIHTHKHGKIESVAHTITATDTHPEEKES
jgi:hypothetical protein